MANQTLKCFVIVLLSVNSLRSYCQNTNFNKSNISTKQVSSIKTIIDETCTHCTFPPNVQPTFQGGDISTFHNWVLAQIVCPKDAGKNSDGNVIIEFSIDTTGQIVNTKIVNTSNDSTLDNEAIRVVSSSPK